ncbi:conserved hypothetical protein [Histoplasma capsulatum var. duboisii H88]|uniref:Rhodopsin domain-containing protein n=2 Tax=Ajellomyces capsulatus TaxID=5037 RepID=F0UW94_AJEC8|nr:conserved hypothetical protein [Histoplasma capsulatum H143]EGC42604.1 conserved hypothetical protein [Histoplasma capsulatum var. duboisii H88]QSS48657.1 hypothetical protein I7I53_08717 [Histoplasma capsulatum var. duboisii H88]
MTSARDSQNKGPLILVVMWVVTCLTTAVVATRLFVRSRMVRMVGLDDWLILISMVLSFIFVVFVTISIRYGFGRHEDTLTPEQLRGSRLNAQIGSLFGILAISFPKLGVAAMLNRILVPTRFHRNVVWLLSGFSLLVGCICFPVLMTICRPHRATWDKRVKNPKCRDPSSSTNYLIFVGAVSAFVDLYFAVYSVVVCWQLKVLVLKKIAVCAALGLGLIACAVAIVKCVHLPTLKQRVDTSYRSSDLIIWTLLEADTVIMASCIPTLKPLLQLFPKRRTSPLVSASYFFSAVHPGRRSHRSSFSGESQQLKELARPTHIHVNSAPSEDTVLPLPSEQGDERSIGP